MVRFIGEPLTSYDRIGVGYAAQRRADPRIEAQIHRALLGARTVANVGAGTGSYEPSSTVLAVEPSAEMIAQRAPDAAPAVRANAEAIPLADDAVDAALAVLTIHHWADLEKGLSEMRRVARQRVVILTWDPAVSFWLMEDYLPSLLAWDRARFPSLDALGGAATEVPIPRDCSDGFLAAFWARPDAYLDPGIRASMSCFAQRPEKEYAEGLARLAADLASGAWRRRYDHDAPTLDAGYRLVTIPAA